MKLIPFEVAEAWEAEAKRPRRRRRKGDPLPVREVVLTIRMDPSGDFATVTEDPPPPKGTE